MAETSLFFLDSKLEKIERLFKLTKMTVHFEERPHPKPETKEGWFLCKIKKANDQTLIFGFGKSPEEALINTLKRTSSSPIEYARGSIGAITEPPTVQLKNELSEQLDFTVVKKEADKSLSPKVEGPVSAEAIATSATTHKLHGAAFKPTDNHTMGGLMKFAGMILRKNKANWMALIPGLGLDDDDFDTGEDIVAP